MKVLLVWEIIPESTELYLIEDPTDAQLKHLEEANGKYLNTNKENDGLRYLNVSLSKPEYCSGEEHAGIWRDKRVESPVDGPIDKVFVSGFAM